MAPDDAHAPDPADLERYARAAATAVGLEIDDAWWGGVVRHLEVLMDRAASLEGAFLKAPSFGGASFGGAFLGGASFGGASLGGGHLPDDQAPVFRP